MKIRLSLIAVLLSLLCFRAQGSHIVGGEFQIVHVSDYTYQIRLNIYFDVINGSTGAQDNSAMARIFRASDGAFMADVNLLLTNIRAVSYTIPVCEVEGLRTNHLVYMANTTWLPSTYNDPGGYYIVWQRCCRNYNITNIFSQNPQLSTQYAGQTFYLFFPPLQKNGLQFINSTPELFPALSDYACVGREFVADFSGRDVDGDSLAFSFVKPLSTNTGDALPASLHPKPYPAVTYRPGYDLGNFMGAGSTVRISSDGVIRIVASTTGLFAFAVRCDEYRNGEKIGEVIREYQLLVLDACPPGQAPAIEAKYGDDYRSGEIDVRLDDNVSGDKRCISVRVKDADNYLKPSERVKLRVVPLDFRGDVSALLPSVASAHLSSADAFAEFQVCITTFPIEANRTEYQIGIIAFDETCSVGLADTVKVNLSLEFKNLPPLPPAKKAQIILFNALSNKTIGESAIQLSATATSGLPIVYTTDNTARASVVSSLLTLHQVGPVTVTATQLGNESYLPATAVKQSFCINPLPPVLSLTRVGSEERIVSNSNATHLWYRNDILVGGNENSIAVEGSLSSYMARIDVEGCLSAPSEPIVVTSLEDVVSGEIEVYPNPAAAAVFVRVAQPATGGRIELRDVSGKLLMTTDLDTNSQLDVSQLKPGLFLLVISHGKRRKIYKIRKI
jgi:hypothetical protein